MLAAVSLPLNGVSLLYACLLLDPKPPGRSIAEPNRSWICLVREPPIGGSNFHVNETILRKK